MADQAGLGDKAAVAAFFMLRFFLFSTSETISLKDFTAKLPNRFGTLFLSSLLK
jgi:hypothetical protein